MFKTILKVIELSVNLTLKIMLLSLSLLIVIASQAMNSADEQETERDNTWFVFVNDELTLTVDAGADIIIDTKNQYIALYTDHIFSNGFDRDVQKKLSDFTGDLE